MELTGSNIYYLTYLFAPFILVSFFLLNSIINLDIKGLVYLIGLIITLTVSIFIGNALLQKQKIPGEEMCHMISISNIKSISTIPLSVITYVFTGCYLLYTMSVNNYIKNNDKLKAKDDVGSIISMTSILAIVFFLILILQDIAIISRQKCYGTNHILLSLFLGGLLGTFWGYLINLTKNKSIQYFSTNPNNCTIPKYQNFRITQ
tara:strand:- start:398 stop:1012 length:615 start_codon:yes stop_codon:yes gene_type:complete